MMGPANVETPVDPRPRDWGAWWAVAAPVAGALAGLLIGAALILLAGASVQDAYRAMLRGAFGGSRQLTETILEATPLLLIGLGLTVAFRARVWNIGGEGQFVAGALCGGAVALMLPGWPPWLLLPAMIVAAIAGSVFWALLAAFLKVRWDVNIIISTLMLNYVAIFLLQYMARGPLQEPGGYLPQSGRFVPAAQLPTLPGTRLHLGILIAVLLVPLVYILLWKTPLGFRLRMVGSRASVARYAGVNVNQAILFVMAFSGALIGLAGVIEASTQLMRLRSGLAVGYGFDGILVALLGRMHPFGVTLAAVLFAALIVGAEAMQVSSGLPSALADAIQAVIVLSVLAVDALARRRQG
jgi:general nucleoside transport system permease protein